MSISSLILLTVSNVIVGSDGVDDVCYHSPADFDNFCTGTLNGVAAKGRCMFALPTTSWEDGFTQCLAQNSILAEPVTSAEMDAFTNRFKTESQPDYWIGMKRETANAAGAQSMVLASTYYYKNKNTRSSSVPVGDMWIKVHQADDTSYTSDEECFYLYVRQPTIPPGVLDAECSKSTLSALCSFINFYHTFTQVVGKTIDKAILSISTDTDADQCAIFCRADNLCRGFNLIPSGANWECQLVGWSYDDYPSPVDSPGSYFYNLN